MEFLLHSVVHTLEDSVRMLPFLYLAYLLIEWLERHHGQAIEDALAGGGRWGFVPGALLGCVPQCGFSAVAANLYASRVVTPGTVLAVFLATSDEAIPLLAAEPDSWLALGLVIALKVVIAIAAGFVLDVPLRRFLPASLYGGYAGHAEEIDCHEEHEESSGIWLAALRHTLEIFAFILAFSFAITLVFELLGHETVAGLFAGLDSGRYDIVCNGVEVTDERAETYDFTVPYGYIHTALAVRKDNEEIQSFEDLEGKVTANSIASTYMTLAEQYGATVQGVDTLDETIQLLVSGRIDATLNADVSFYDYLKVNPDADFKIVALTDDASHVAIPMRKGAETATLMEAVNQAIEELRADGTLGEISMKYFGSDIASEE